MKDYIAKTPKGGCWVNQPKYFVSLLKAFWGDAAQPGNDFAYDYLPKVGKGYQNSGYSWIPLFESMGAGGIKGLLVWGMNPAMSSPDLNQTYAALAKLEWLAAFDLWETDTAHFWKRPGAKTEDIKTEVFLFPVADSLEKEGSISNSGRWLQWRYQALPPRGDAQSDLWYLNRLALELKKLYKEDPKAASPEPIVNLAWNYGDDPDVHLVAKEVNGYTVADKKQVANFTKLADDGSTACGNWIYSGSYPGPDQKNNLMARRDKKDPGGLGIYANWSWAWPVNRRIILQPLLGGPRGPALEQGQVPVQVDPVAKTWTKFDVPDLAGSTPRPISRFRRRCRPRRRSSCCPKARAGSSCPAGSARKGPCRSTTRPWSALT